MVGGAPRAPTQAAAAAGIKGGGRAARGTAARRRHRHLLRIAPHRTAGKHRALPCPLRCSISRSAVLRGAPPRPVSAPGCGALRRCGS